MNKVIVLAILMLAVLTPLSFAALSPCQDVNSPDYLTATASKLIRGIGNAALSWVELFRQPMINENKWEGVGRGVLQTGVRAVAGALEAATAIVPKVNIPQPNPPCPTDMVNKGAS